MTKYEPITAHVDVDTMEAVRILAKARGVSDEHFIVEAIRRVAESEADYRAFIQVGIDAADRGEFIPHDEVMAELDTMIAKHEARCRP